MSEYICDECDYESDDREEFYYFPEADFMQCETCVGVTDAHL